MFFTAHCAHSSSRTSILRAAKRCSDHSCLSFQSRTRVELCSSRIAGKNGRLTLPPSFQPHRRLRSARSHFFWQRRARSRTRGVWPPYHIDVQPPTLTMGPPLRRSRNLLPFCKRGMSAVSVPHSRLSSRIRNSSLTAASSGLCCNMCTRSRARAVRVSSTSTV
ncbi:hypothetical protein BC826DRAFT_1164792 [Russula brevipes]|nr:hypothetical protein BC826DRAFT_1164792 [Russula brevipes]